MRGLLDVNVLIAVLDEGHVHHQIAHNWFVGHGKSGWATCPLTENGAVRIMSQKAYSANTQFMVPFIIDLIIEKKTTYNHEFWSDSLSITNVAAFRSSEIASHRAITDIYLLGLAVANGGTLITFDQNINLAAVPRAKPQNLTVL